MALYYTNTLDGIMNIEPSLIDAVIEELKHRLQITINVSTDGWCEAELTTRFRVGLNLDDDEISSDYVCVRIP